MNYIFNPKYILRNDKDRILLTNHKEFAGDRIFYFLHPIHAVMLSYFNGSQNYDETIHNIMKDFDINESTVKRLTENLIENQNNVHFRYDGTVFSLPPNILVHNASQTIRTDLDKDSLMIDSKLNFSRRRLGRPMNLLICINLKCVTDCVYCYANRKVLYTPMKPQKLIDLIYEAKRIGIESVDITGGEFFLNPEWEDITKALLDCGYAPDISTKIPLSHETIDRIVATGLKTIQFSLDTVNQERARRNLNVGPNYIDKLLDAIRYCDEKGLRVIIKPTMDRETCTIENVDGVIDFAKTLKHLERCVFTIIGYSCYKTEQSYLNIRPTMEQVDIVAQHVSKRAVEMSCPMYNDNQLFHKAEMNNMKTFSNRALCTANVDGLVVLPDGQVTICEELYWNKSFILVWGTERSV